MEQQSKNISFFQKLKKVFFPFYRSKDIKKLFNILEKNKPKNTQVAMFVGGCVRNFLANEEIDDIDIATIFSPEEIKEKFKDSEFKIIETGVEHGSLTIILNSSKFEITTLREDTKTDGRHAEVSFIANWKEDSCRRDFTINAIYMDKKGKIYDPQNGREDLKNKCVRFIGEPSARIEEDYLRIIRFIRFSIHYDSKQSDPKIIEAIKLNLSGINNLSKERILNELYKIFKLKSINILLKNKEIKKIFLITFPEFKYLDRLEKFLLLLESNILFKFPEIIFSILLVDEKDNYQYFCHKYKVPNKLKKDLSFTAENYIQFKEDKNYLKKDLKKNIYIFGKNNIKKLLGFIYCAEPKFTTKLLNNIVEEVNKTNIPNFPFNGQYLMDLGLVDGKKIGYTLRLLEKEWIQKDFNLKTQEIALIVDKIKKLNILNI
jgi:tRNA nucleotidyltransferase/poly(A) polymerase